MVPANDNTPPTVACPPADAVAHIHRPARSAMSSAPGLRRPWRLTFAPRSAPFVEPLMGWTGSRETLTQVELTFPTLDAAVGYARRQGLRYSVRHDERPQLVNENRARRRRAFSDATLRRLRLDDLQATYGKAMTDADAASTGGDEPHAWLTAMDIVEHPTLTADEKRSILMNRAFDAHLCERQTDVAAGSAHSSLEEIERALQALESRHVPRISQPAQAAAC